MAGQLKRMIDQVIEERSKGNPTLKGTTRTKLILKGIQPDAYTDASPDDPAMMHRVRMAASELGVSL